MKPDFDLIIIGSGPAGVSAAFPLVTAGLKVLMVDGGSHTIIPPIEPPFLTARTEDPNQWEWMIGKDFHSLKMQDAVSPKLRVPGHKYVFENYAHANAIESKDFIVVGSLATGGLSNAWGCGVSRLSEAELSNYPVSSSHMDRSYRAVAQRIGISGSSHDDLSDFFRLDEISQPPIPMDPLHTQLWTKYQKHRKAITPVGFRLGRARVAALNQAIGDRKACDCTGNCLWGCHRKALYSSADELPALKQYPNFHHQNGFVVERLKAAGEFWRIQGTRNLKSESITARKIILAAGTIATTRLALQALKLTKPIPMLSCPIAAFMLWNPWYLGQKIQSSFGFGQLSYTLKLDQGITGFGSTFGISGIPVSEFLGHLPFSRRYSIDIFKGVSSSCIVGNLFLPGDLSPAQVELKGDDSLHISGGYRSLVPQLMKTAAKRLRKAYFKLGFFLLPGSFTLGAPGGDIHYAGTLPMRDNPELGETNSTGEIQGIPGVHIVDGACLPTLPGKSHTLTIMANADRIGRRLCEMPVTT